MTRSEVIQLARDLLEEEDTNIFTQQRARRAVNSIVKDFTKRTGILQFVLPVSVSANTPSVSLPEACVGILRITSDPYKETDPYTFTMQAPTNETAYTYTFNTPNSGSDPAVQAALKLWSDYMGNYATYNVPSWTSGANVFFSSPKPYFTAFTDSDTGDAALVTKTMPIHPAGVERVVFYTGSSTWMLKRYSRRLWTYSDPRWMSDPRTGTPVWWDVVGQMLHIYPTPTSGGVLYVYGYFEHPEYPETADWDSAPLILPEETKDGIAAGVAARGAQILRDRPNTAELIALFRADYEDAVGRFVTRTLPNTKVSGVYGGIPEWPLFVFQSPEV